MPLFIFILAWLLVLVAPASSTEIDPITGERSNLPLMARARLPEKPLPPSKSLFYSKRVYSSNAATSHGDVRKGFDFEYVGGEIIFDRTALLKTRANTRYPRGAELYLHIPMGRLSPFVSFGENLRAAPLGDGFLERQEVWVSGGANLHLDDHTDAFARYAYVDRYARVPTFKKPERITSLGFVHRF